MKLFVDTANVAEIEALMPLGIIDGVTTNPSLLAKAAGNPQPAFIRVEGHERLVALFTGIVGQIADLSMALYHRKVSCLLRFENAENSARVPETAFATL